MLPLASAYKTCCCETFHTLGLCFQGIRYAAGIAACFGVSVDLLAYLPYPLRPEPKRPLVHSCMLREKN